VEHRQLPEEYKTELSGRSVEAYRQIRKAIDTGSFLLCEGAMQLLEELRRGIAEADSAEHYYKYLEANFSAVEKCFDELPAIAKKDLGVK